MARPTSPPRRAYPIPSCAECGIEAGGRCPTCHRSLCLDHFPLNEHQPCAQRLLSHRDNYVCYVCGVPVLPQQWSTTAFAHYIDPYTCHGCKRHICDDPHTSRSEESIELVRDGLRSHRYHVTRRYCAVCAPFQHFGGIRGIVSWGVGVASVAAVVALIVLH